jgi:hypothetical protein
MATIASPSATSLYLNAFDKTIQYEGIIKTIDDDYWTSDIVPILYPMWDSDNDKLKRNIHVIRKLEYINGFRINLI